MNNAALFENPNATERTVLTPWGNMSTTSTTNFTGCLGSGIVNKTSSKVYEDLHWYWYTDGRCPTYGAGNTFGCAYGTNKDYGAINTTVNKFCRKCYPTSVFSRLAFTAEGIYGDSQSGQGKTTHISSYPICPPVVCQHYNLTNDECAVETLPEATSVKEVPVFLDTLFSREKFIVRYASNLASNPPRPSGE